MLLHFRVWRSKAYGSTAIWRRYDDVFIRDVPDATTAVYWWDEQPAVPVPDPEESNAHEQ